MSDFEVDLKVDLKHDEIVKSLVKGYKNGKVNVTAPLPEYMYPTLYRQLDSAIFLAKILRFDTSVLKNNFEIFSNKDFEKLLDEHGLLDDNK